MCERKSSRNVESKSLDHKISTIWLFISLNLSIVSCADSTWGPRLIKSTDSHENSVLHVTARDNDISAMTVLMELQVESDIKNVDGKTPMHLAAEKGHQE